MLPDSFSRLFSGPVNDARERFCRKIQSEQVQSGEDELQVDMTVDNLHMRSPIGLRIPERFVSLPFTLNSMPLLDDMATLGAPAPCSSAKVALLRALFSPGRDRAPDAHHYPSFSRFYKFFSMCQNSAIAPLAVLKPAELESILSSHSVTSADSTATTAAPLPAFPLLDRTMFLYTRTYRRMSFFDFSNVDDIGIVEEPSQMAHEYENIEEYPHL